MNHVFQDHDFGAMFHRRKPSLPKSGENLGRGFVTFGIVRSVDYKARKLSCTHFVQETMSSSGSLFVIFLSSS